MRMLRTTLLESRDELQVQRTDSNSPLYSVKTFEELALREELLKAIYKMGFHRPSKIQETALPTLMANPATNMIAQSQSGTGKTATFLLASLSRLDETLDHPQVLILSPTFELARQTAAIAQQMTQFCPGIGVRFAIRGQTLLPGTKIQEQIVIGTPGKILDWALKFRFFDISKIKVFVLDEADVMLAGGGHHDLSIRIHRQLPADCQMMLFSSTYDEEVVEFANLMVPEPCIKITLKREEQSRGNIEQYVMHCPDVESKIRALVNIYSSLSVGQAVIFCHTKPGAAQIARTMMLIGQRAAILTGDLEIDERIRVLGRFRDGLDKVLVTTNVCARGIDIQQVSLVINFDLPVDYRGEPDFETYLHRIGRTGRFGKTGVAINFVDPNCSRDLLNIDKIQEHFKRNIKFLDFEDFELLEKIGRQY
ncbi:DEAD-box helicase Dbp80 [Galendromus occidentalis]|uniref:RNA helicase n=1 Tax=Galendromus occidentalis TaxID=34638 RepID=A0AAJ6W0J0_9ACAR|nr:DEAD-box helicase Dbp80 [Galendromus occidentalis]